MSIAKKAKRLAVLSALKKHYEATTDRIGNEINKLMVEVYDEMTDGNIKEFKVGSDGFKDGLERKLKPDLSPRPNVKDKDKFYAWLRSNGASDLIRDSVHHASLETWIKKRKAANKEMPPEDLVKIFDQKRVRITASRPKGK